MPNTKEISYYNNSRPASSVLFNKKKKKKKPRDTEAVERKQNSKFYNISGGEYKVVLYLEFLSGSTSRVVDVNSVFHEAFIPGTFKYGKKNLYPSFGDWIIVDSYNNMVKHASENEIPRNVNFNKKVTDYLPSLCRKSKYKIRLNNILKINERDNCGDIFEVNCDEFEFDEQRNEYSNIDVRQITTTNDEGIIEDDNELYGKEFLKNDKKKFLSTSKKKKKKFTNDNSSSDDSNDFFTGYSLLGNTKENSLKDFSLSNKKKSSSKDIPFLDNSPKDTISLLKSHSFSVKTPNDDEIDTSLIDLFHKDSFLPGVFDELSKKNDDLKSDKSYDCKKEKYLKNKQKREKLLEKEKQIKRMLEKESK